MAITTQPSQDTTYVTVVPAPGEEVPTLGYPTGGGDFSVQYNSDGTYSSTIKIVSGASGGTVSGYTGTGSVTVTTQPVVPVIVDPVTIPYPPSIYSNEYQEWRDTYFEKVEIPEESEPWYIDGYLKDQNGNPLAGQIIARNRETDELYDVVRPDEVTGFYKLDVPTLIEMYLYVILDSGQAVIIDHFTCTKDVSWDFDYLELYGNHERFIYPWTDSEFWSGFALSDSGHKLFGVSVRGTDRTKIKLVEWNLPENNEILNRQYVREYTLTLPSGIGTSTGAAIWINPAGTQMYIYHPHSAKVYKYGMSIAWNVSSLYYTGNATPSTTAGYTGSYFMEMSPNGLWVDYGSKQLKLSSAWDLSTAIVNDSGAGPTNRAANKWYNNGQVCLCWVSGTWYGYDDFTTPYDWTTQIGGIDRSGNDLFNGDGYLAFASSDGRVVYSNQEGDDYTQSDIPYADTNRFYRADSYDPEWPQTLRPAHKHIGYNFAMSDDPEETYATVSLFSPDGKKVSFLDGYYRAHYWELGTAWNIGTAVHKASVDEAQNPWRDFQISGEGIPFYQIFDIMAGGDGKTIYIVENYQMVREIYLSRPWDFTSLVRGVFGQTDPSFDPEWNCNNRTVYLTYTGHPDDDPYLDSIQPPVGHEGSFYGASFQGGCFHPSGMYVYLLDYTNGYVWQARLNEPFKVHWGCLCPRNAPEPILTSPWNENFEGDWDVGSLQISNDGTRMFSQVRDNPYRYPVERGNFSYHVLDTPFDVRTLRTIKQITVPTLNAGWNPDTCQYHIDGKSMYANDYYVGMVQSDVVNKYG